MNKISSVKLNIFQNWEEDLYLFFKNLNLKNNIFINFDSMFDGKYVIININEKNFDDYNCKKRNKCPTWNELECNKEIKLSNLLTIKTNCTFNNANELTTRKDRNIASYYNVFVKDIGQNLYDYINNIKNDNISKEDNTKLFSYLFSILLKLRSNKDLKCYCKMNVDNHNEDVNILHFKFMAPSCSIDSYKRKYLKYKMKYLELKNHSIS